MTGLKSPEKEATAAPSEVASGQFYRKPQNPPKSPKIGQNGQKPQKHDEVVAKTTKTPIWGTQNHEKRPNLAKF